LDGGGRGPIFDFAAHSSAGFPLSFWGGVRGAVKQRHRNAGDRGFYGGAKAGAEARYSAARKSARGRGGDGRRLQNPTGGGGGDQRAGGTRGGGGGPWAKKHGGALPADYRGRGGARSRCIFFRPVVGPAGAKPPGETWSYRAPPPPRVPREVLRGAKPASGIAGVYPLQGTDGGGGGGPPTWARGKGLGAGISGGWGTQKPGAGPWESAGWGKTHRGPPGHHLRPPHRIGGRGTTGGGRGNRGPNRPGGGQYQPQGPPLEGGAGGGARGPLFKSPHRGRGAGQGRPNHWESRIPTRPRP